MAAIHMSSDGELVTRSLEGDSAAFGDLYDRYFSAVYDFLHRTLRNAEDAADATQDTFLRAMQNLRSLANPAAFKSWLFSIAHNQALNRLERQKRFVVPPPVSQAGVEESDPLLCQIDGDRLANPEQALEMQETARLVWEAAGSLDRRTYAVLDLHVRQGLESAEIAEVLGVSKGNAYTILTRMKRSVEEAIGAYLLMRRGSKDCAGLQRIVAPFAIPPVTQEMRRAVERHVKDCDVCERTRRALLTPLAVFGAFAAVPPPAGLRDRIWGNLAAQWTLSGPPSYVSSGPAKSLHAGKGAPVVEGSGLGLSLSGRNLAMVLGAVLIMALLPVFVVFSFPFSGGGSSTSLVATATKRPATVTRPPTARPSVTATKGPPSPTPTDESTSVPLPPIATPRPTSTPAHTVRPTATPRPAPTATIGPAAKPTHTPRPTDTVRPTRTPRPT
jgi:RNA polymerase sigma factor (sigma-70 family)